VLTAALIPFALALHLTRSLRVIDRRLEDVEEFTVPTPGRPPQAGRPPHDNLPAHARYCEHALD
jgi:hypothetical protein